MHQPHILKHFNIPNVYLNLICENKNPVEISESTVNKTIDSLHAGYRGSYMSAHVLLNLLNELGKEIKCEACQAFYLFFATSLIN